jgi:hypothetical protein
MKHEPHGDCYNIVCYYCCSPWNWNFLHSSVYCSSTILWTRDIYKMSNNFYSLPRRIPCRVLQMDTLLSHKRLSHAHTFLYETMSLSLQPRLGEGRSCPTCVVEGCSFFSYARGTGDERYILFKITALDLNDIYSFVSKNLCSMRNLGQSYATKCVWL